MKWLKENLLLMVFLLLFVVLLGLGLWYQERTASTVTQVDTDLKQQLDQLDKLRKAPIFPMRENIELLRASYKELETLYLQLTNSVGKSTIEFPERSPIKFQQAMAKTLGRLRTDATNASVAVAETFAFGFSDYATRLPCRHSQQETEECRRTLEQLGKQLVIVEHITDLLLGSRVEEIKEIRRTAVEPGEVGGDILDANPAVPVARDAKSLQKVMPFEFKFVCTTESLRKFLNDLMHSKYFLSVRNVRIEGETLTEKQIIKQRVAASLDEPAPAPVAVQPIPKVRVAPGAPVRPGAFPFPVSPPPNVFPGQNPAFVPGPSPFNVTEEQYQRNRLNVTIRVEYIEFQTQPSVGPGGRAAK